MYFSLVLTNAKVVIEELFANWGETQKIVDDKNLRQKNDMWALESIVDEVLANSQKQVEDYKWWNVNIFGFFVGQCMKASKWSGNPNIFTDILKKKLD